MTRSLCTLFDPSITISTNLMIRIRWSRSLLPAAGMIELLAESEGVPDIVEEVITGLKSASTVRGTRKRREGLASVSAMECSWRRTHL